MTAPGTAQVAGRQLALGLPRARPGACSAVGLAFAGVVLALRYWVLPNIENYRDDIARIVSERARQKVTIGSIQRQLGRPAPAARCSST